MIKITALIFLAAASVSAGQYVNSRLKKRVESLRLAIIMVQNLSSEINYSARPLPDIITQMSRRSDLGKLGFLSSVGFGDFGSFPDQWKNALLSCRKKDCFSEEDADILLSFGSSLGTTDRSGQTANCELHIKMLERQLGEAQRSVNERVKINTALSIITGGAIAVILY